MNISRDNVYKLFKYTVYAALTVNVYLFFAEEWAASAHQFVDGVALEDIIEEFAASIDTAAWVVLLIEATSSISGTHSCGSSPSYLSN